MFAQVGHAIEVLYSTGYHYLIEYLDDKHLRWTSLQESNQESGIDIYYVNVQANNIYTISWIEKSGFSVSQNLNLITLEVYAFMSWNDSSAYGGRAILDHKGTFRIIR